MKPIHYGALLLLGAVWGASFLFIGIAVPEFGPLSAAGAQKMLTHANRLDLRQTMA